jgi:hypothetical protein
MPDLASGGYSLHSIVPGDAGTAGGARRLPAESGGAAPLLVDGNPIEGIAAALRISPVVLRGERIQRPGLEQRCAISALGRG